MEGAFESLRLRLRLAAQEIGPHGPRMWRTLEDSFASPASPQLRLGLQSVQKVEYSI